jgi:hypothetical protein
MTPGGRYHSIVELVKHFLRDYHISLPVPKLFSLREAANYYIEIQQVQETANMRLGFCMTYRYLKDQQNGYSSQQMW